MHSVGSQLSRVLDMHAKERTAMISMALTAQVGCRFACTQSYLRRAASPELPARLPCDAVLCNNHQVDTDVGACWR